MKQYRQHDIRNIALTGHGGSGKTTLAEALIFQSGGSDRMGRVTDGTAITDYDAEEIKRKVSLGTALAYAEWKDVKLNILDTPGQFDFLGDMYGGVRAAESVVICLSAKDGIQVGTIKAYKEATKNGRAVLFAVTKAEEENSNFYKVLEDLKTTFGPSVCPVVVPFDKTGKVESYFNLLEQKAYTYDKSGTPKEVAIPASENRLRGLRTAMAESIAETDEELMLRFFENDGDDFTRAEMIKGLHDGVDNATIAPVVCCSAEPLAAIDMLLDTITYMLPSPSELGGEPVHRKKVKIGNENEPFSAFVFKTIADPFVGKISLAKIVGGVLSHKVVPVNARTGEPEHFGKILALRGKKQEELTEAYAGDLVALTKLTANTNDTLAEANHPVSYDAIVFPEPCYFQAVSAKGNADDSKISSAITRILEEDKTLGYENNAETHQRILSGLGEQHLDVAVHKMKNKFGVDVELSDPIIAYRETIRKKVSVEGKHKKQSGGHGQFGHVKIEFEPYGEDALLFEERVFGGVVPKNFFPAVEKGLQESIAHGVLAGYPVVRLKATLFDGSAHAVDSSEMAFKMAAHIAYKTGLTQASPCLLEPIVHMKITVNDDSTGDVMGVLNKRRGSVLGMNPLGDGITEIEAEIPRAETVDFSTVIRQITRGMGSFTMEFARYEMLPANLEAEVIAKAPKFSEYEG